MTILTHPRGNPETAHAFREGIREPYWLKKILPPSFPKLGKDASADILIVGAGITGATAAYFLSKAGKNVILVDAGEAGGGETSHTTAHLTAVLDGLEEIFRINGREKTQAVVRSHLEAIDDIESIAARENIECGFERVDGCLFQEAADSPEKLHGLLALWQEAGLRDTGWTDASPLGEGPALRIGGQAQFHPVLYMHGLLSASGARIYSHTPVQKIEKGGVITKDGRPIRAPQILIATHSPLKNILFFLKEAAYRSYVVAAKISKGAVPHRLYWDTADPYHYVRLAQADEHSDMLIVGGEDHKTGQSKNYKKPFRALESWMRQKFPSAGALEYSWSGQILEPVDGLAFIGRSPHSDNGLFLATGYSGNGMTYGTIAGKLLSELVLGKNPYLAKIFDPGRTSLGSAARFLEENANAVARFVTGRLPEKNPEAKTVRSPEDLAPDEGAVIQKGLNHWAVYRDALGKIHASSALCPHLGCIVQWNEAEKTFDCPCHGSRFGKEGNVLNGPAERDLKPVRRTQSGD